MLSPTFGASPNTLLMKLWLEPPAVRTTGFAQSLKNFLASAESDSKPLFATTSLANFTRFSFLSFWRSAKALAAAAFFALN